MCFEVPALGAPANGIKSGSNSIGTNDDDLGLMDPDANDIKHGSVLCFLSLLSSLSDSFG